MRPLIGALLSLTLVLGGLLVWDDLARAAAIPGMSDTPTSPTAVRAMPRETEVAPMPWTLWVGLIAVGVSLFDVVLVTGRSDATPMADDTSPGFRIVAFATCHPVAAGHLGPRRLLHDGAGLDCAGDRIGQPATDATG